MNEPNVSCEESAGLWDRPGFLLRLCLQETGQAFERGCAEVGLTPRQFDFLFVLNGMEETTQDRLVRSTDKGRAAFAKASPAAEAAKARLFERLSEGERGQLMHLLRKISEPAPRVT